MTLGTVTTVMQGEGMQHLWFPRQRWLSADMSLRINACAPPTEENTAWHISGTQSSINKEKVWEGLEASTGDISNGANGQHFLQQVQHLLPHWREQTSDLESCQLPISPLLNTICKMAHLALSMYRTATCYCSTLINSNSNDGWQWCALHSQNTVNRRAHGNKCGQQMDSSLSSWCLSQLNDSDMRWTTCVRMWECLATLRE